MAQVQPTYDAVGNVASVTTTLAAIPGVAGTGGTETQAFCYDEQDRLVWASTQASGSCGTVGSESVSGAGYAYVEGNPLVWLDPPGHDWFGSIFTAVVQTAVAVVQAAAPVVSAVTSAASAVLDATIGIPSMNYDVQTIFSGKAS